MNKILGFALIVLGLTFQPVQAASVNGWTYYTFDSYDVSLTNAVRDNALTGWIELRSGNRSVGYIWLRPLNETLGKPRLGATDTPEPYVAFDVPISSLATLMDLFEHRMPMQVRYAPGPDPSVFLERPFAAGVDPAALAPMAMGPLAEGAPVDDGGARAAGLKLANWNIQTLTMPGERVFPDQKPEELRTQADFDKLKIVRDEIGADVFALQEISSLRALAQVFPTSDWQLCFSGQYDADAAGFAPYYDPADIAAIAPTCVVDADDAALPDPAPGVLRKQYTAFAIKKGAGVTVDSVRDIANLSVPAEDKDGAGIAVRGVRWGFEALLDTPAGKVRVLDVHMKTGCFTDDLRSMWWLDQTPWAQDGQRDHPCMTYARQLPALRAWIADAKVADVPFLILGDYNRRIDIEAQDAETPDLFPILNGGATPDDASDDVALDYIPRGATSVLACWPEEASTDRRDAIEFFVFGPGDLPADWETSYRKLRYVDVAAIGGASLVQVKDSPHLSDHCPSVVTIH